jgi:ABC-2 type transport system ATP-binding protein
MIQPDSPGSASALNHRDWVIQTDGLTRFFGRKCAVDNLSFRVPRGSVFAFIGRNGAGKTTTIRMILGLLEPKRGSSTILGCDSAALPPETRARIGYMAEGHPVYAWMRVGQYARFQSGFYRHWNLAIFASVIDYFAMDPHTRAGDLSHGQRAGLHLAMTLAIEPEVLMLDDPATGLDPAARRSLLEAMLYFTRSRERTIFFSSHLLDRAVGPHLHRRVPSRRVAQSEIGPLVRTRPPGTCAAGSSRKRPAAEHNRPGRAGPARPSG